MKRAVALSLGVVVVLSLAAAVAKAPPAKDDSVKPATRMKPETFAGLVLRGIGPALMSGRVDDIAIHPTRRSTWYLAVASGGVWKSTNAGTTWTPIFDGQGSYSIGCVALDPRNPLIVWVGTGENNSQRSVGYGDGVYRSTDGGVSWDNVGLKASEHVGKILLDPRNTGVVYVAAQGPLWAGGGDRGLYKTTDNGKAWKKVLEISENTGVTDVVMDPRDSAVLYAASYQRRRHVWGLIDGGPESAIWKTTDAGATWKKLENGLPKEEMGRIGLAISPASPDTVYATIEAANKAGGFYRSTDAGGSWEKMSATVSGAAQYYQEIFPDPKVVDRVYMMDTWMQVTDDAGRTFRKVGEKYKHVDNHALFIDPDDTDHLIAGCDGGVYETFDRAATWAFKANLPVAQFYRVAVDEAAPFYNVYGGTQDNNTMGGPSRTATAHGITNADWFVTVGGDGFQSRVDPLEPSIVYSESQYGGLGRFDRRTGEVIDIQPQPGDGEEPLRYNWDSPLLISPHSHTRLYFAAQRILRSDDRGDSWRAISPDLTRRTDRNRLKMMGRVWSVDSVAKNASTSFYGNIVSLAESPRIEGLIYAGTDDGLVQVTEDGGGTWRRVGTFPGVPEGAYVAYLLTSRHDADTVYAAFDHHKNADFKPYLLKSGDRGRTWASIAGDLPERGTVYALAEDPAGPGLLFAGTEFGVFFTTDGGKRWVQLKGGIPTIAVRDLAIQKRDGDLVVATFGRGFYVLDDISPLRAATPDLLGKEAVLFPVRPAFTYVPSAPLGLKEKSSQGDAYFTAPNPPFGAVFTVYLRDEIKTLKKQRQDREKEIAKKGGDVFYPTWDELRAEDREEEPALILTVTDASGNVVHRLSAPTKEGFQRVAWDLRYPPVSPTDLKPQVDDDPWAEKPIGPMAAPGTYKVSLAKRVGGKLTPLGETQSFVTSPLGAATLPEPDRAAVLAFSEKTSRLQRAVLGAAETVKEAQGRIDHLKKALFDTPKADPRLREEALALEGRLKDISMQLSGDETVASRNEPTPPSIVSRVQGIVYGQWTTTSAPTGTQRAAYDVAATRFGEILDRLRTLAAQDLPKLEGEAEAAGSPWTPGRIPMWRRE
ncbi:MAG: glycosyl hydrolase [Acidobacteriia bacterium]|nr:glycosyl hydrolase [Terriglobia bacterium]